MPYDVYGTIIYKQLAAQIVMDYIFLYLHSPYKKMFLFKSV